MTSTGTAQCLYFYRDGYDPAKLEFHNLRAIIIRLSKLVGHLDGRITLLCWLFERKRNDVAAFVFKCLVNGKRKQGYCQGKKQINKIFMCVLQQHHKLANNYDVDDFCDKSDTVYIYMCVGRCTIQSYLLPNTYILRYLNSVSLRTLFLCVCVRHTNTF